MGWKRWQAGQGVDDLQEGGTVMVAHAVSLHSSAIGPGMPREKTKQNDHNGSQRKRKAHETSYIKEL